MAGFPQMTHGADSPAPPPRVQSREIGMMNPPFQAERDLERAAGRSGRRKRTAPRHRTDQAALPRTSASVFGATSAVAR